MAVKLTIVRGSTFQRVLRWGSQPLIYKAVTAVPNTAPLRLTATGHGAPNGWPVAIMNLGGMTEANSLNTPPKMSDYLKTTFIDANTLEFNSINAAAFSPYTSGGQIQYLTPVDLTGYTAKMEFRTRADLSLTPLLSLVSPTNIALDNTAKTITVTIAAAVTKDLVLNNATFDLELVSPGGVVTKLLSGTATTVNESTS